MTPERCKELLPVMQAFAEGREIQSFSVNDKEWKTLEYSQWHDEKLYRIKPEPRLRPWTPEEAVGKVVREKVAPGGIFLITSAHQDRVYAGGVPLWRGNAIPQNFEQLDGSPCGVYEEAGDE